MLKAVIEQEDQDSLDAWQTKPLIQVFNRAELRNSSGILIMVR
jgi:hypothetical protein